MDAKKSNLIGSLLFDPLVPAYARPEAFEGTVAVVATPFNCYLRGDDPDKTNEMIAEIVVDFMKRYDLPFFGQWEQGHLLQRRGFGSRVRMMDTANGERAESQRLGRWAAQHIKEECGGTKVIRVGMPEHLGRCVAIDRYFGLEPVVPIACEDVPYDDTKRPGTQRWCTSRPVFSGYERLVARPGTVAKLLLGAF